MCWIQLGYKTHSKTGKLFFWLDSEAVGRGDVLWEIIRFRFQRLVASSQAQELPYRAKKQNSRITRNYYLPPPPTRMSFSNHEKKMVISISDLFTSFFPPAKNWVKQVAKSVVLIETWRNRSKRSSLAETKPFQLRCWGCRSGAHIGWGARSAWTPRQTAGRRVRRNAWRWRCFGGCGWRRETHRSDWPYMGGTP